MTRPEHLNCINTVEGIKRINEMQREYDRDPQAWERREREHTEERELEKQQEAEEERRFYERQREQNNDIPF